MFQVYALLGKCLQEGLCFTFPKSVTGRRQRTYVDTLFRNLMHFFVDIPYPIGYREHGFHYVPIPEVPDRTSIYGYFQSYRYFETQLPLINAVLGIDALRAEVHDKLTDLSPLFDPTGPSVAMHFRIGDYKHLQDAHPVMKPTYYLNALKTIQDVLNESSLKVTYFYEIEDAEYVRGIIAYLQTHFPSMEFSPIPEGLEDYEEMLAMSLYSHNIIANSSFSWWGAYLNDNPDKIVCYPDQWFGPSLRGHNTKDLCPSGWHCIRGEP